MLAARAEGAEQTAAANGGQVVARRAVPVEAPDFTFVGAGRLARQAEDGVQRCSVLLVQLDAIEVGGQAFDVGKLNLHRSSSVGDLSPDETVTPPGDYTLSADRRPPKGVHVRRLPRRAPIARLGGP